MARTVWEVQPSGTEWVVKRRGASQATRRFRLKSDAVSFGVSLARANEPSQLIIKRGNGTIEDERTYGNDPFPPRG